MKANTVFGHAKRRRGVWVSRAWGLGACTGGNNKVSAGLAAGFSKAGDVAWSCRHHGAGGVSDGPASASSPPPPLQANHQEVTVSLARCPSSCPASPKCYPFVVVGEKQEKKKPQCSPPIWILKQQPPASFPGANNQLNWLQSAITCLT